MKAITDTFGMVRASDLYAELAKVHKKSPITIYKTVAREGVFKCRMYSMTRGRLEYWFTQTEAEQARQKMAEHYASLKRKP